MTWWLWLLFWALFWAAAAAYLAWRTWRVWPHARDFGRTLSEAWQRLDHARDVATHATASTGAAREPGAAAARATAPAPGDGEHALAPVRSTTDDLAWNKPARQWRAERRVTRRRRAALRLDDHSSVWASWRHPLD